jgi:hypothetical protein
MKTLKSITYLFIISILLISCDSNEDGNPLTTCESDFYGLYANTSYINTGDKFNLGKYHKSGVLGIPVDISIDNPFTATNGWMQNYTSTYNASLNELTCLLPTNNSLIKCDISSGTTTSTTISNVVAPAYIGTSLRLLKYSNIISTTTAFPVITNVDLQIVDESGVSVSGSPITVTLNSQSLGNINLISSATFGSKIYYLANCDLIIYDTVANTFLVKKFDNYNSDTDRKFYQGLELKNNTTLVALKQSVIPTIKINVAAIDVSDLTLTTLPSTEIFTMTQAMLPLTAPTLSVIINALEYRTTTYDSCDDNYYFTYSTPSIVSVASTQIFEIKLNSVSTTPTVNVYTDSSSKILFAFEKGM